MDYQRNKDDEEEEIDMLNGRALMYALEFLKPEATEDELLKCFTTSNDDSQHSLIQQELKRMLNNGVINGFIAKNNNKYSIPRLENSYQVDCDEKGRTKTPIVITVDPKSRTATYVPPSGGGGPVAIPSSSIVEVIDGKISIREASKKKRESMHSGPAKRARATSKGRRSSGRSSKRGRRSGAGVC